MQPTGSAKQVNLSRQGRRYAAASTQATARQRWHGHAHCCAARARRGGRRVGVASRLSGGSGGWLRLHGRRLRDGAQAARFARARPDGRPAGARRPRCWRRSLPCQPPEPPTKAKEDTMNRWTGTGHLTEDPKFLETESGTAICTLRLAVKRAGKQGQDGYFDVKCAQYLKAGREV